MIPELLGNVEAIVLDVGGVFLIPHHDPIGLCTSSDVHPHIHSLAELPG